MRNDPEKQPSVLIRNNRRDRRRKNELSRWSWAGWIWGQSVCCRFVWVSAVMAGMMLSGCTLAGSTSADSPSNAPSDASDGALEMPSVRLPSLRISRRSVVPISSLMADREASKVAVSGTVTQRAAILEGWLYEVADETGRLWVLTDSSDPEVGAIATVEGIIRYEPIVVGEIDAGSVYLEEKIYQQEPE